MRQEQHVIMLSSSHDFTVEKCAIISHQPLWRSMHSRLLQILIISGSIRVIIFSCRIDVQWTSLAKLKKSLKAAFGIDVTFHLVLNPAALFIYVAFSFFILLWSQNRFFLFLLLLLLIIYTEIFLFKSELGIVRLTIKFQIDFLIKFSNLQYTISCYWHTFIVY